MKRISISMPVGMGKPWSIADTKGKFAYVEIEGSGDGTVTFRAATQISLIETRVELATVYSYDFKVVVPARVLKSMRAVRAGTGYPRRYTLTIAPDHEDYWIETSFGDGLRIRGKLESESHAFPKNAATAIPSIVDGRWEASTSPERAMEIPELQRMLGAMPTSLRRAKLYFRGGRSQPLVAQSTGVHLKSTIALLPTIWESA